MIDSKRRKYSVMKTKIRIVLHRQFGYSEKRFQINAAGMPTRFVLNANVIDNYCLK